MTSNETTSERPAHPNDFDRKRVERALQARKRYRYVSPSVAMVPQGYRIESPCCSRNVDSNGGVVDVALLLHDAERAVWQLFRKDHGDRTWHLHSTHERLSALLEGLNADPGREFWQ